MAIYLTSNNMFSMPKYTSLYKDAIKILIMGDINAKNT